jgi:hypothetical protein
LVESSHVGPPPVDGGAILDRSEIIRGWYVSRFPMIANLLRHSIRYPDPLIKVNDTVKVK